MNALTGAFWRMIRSAQPTESVGQERPFDPRAARRILIGLMVPVTLMPLLTSSTGVALPIIRDNFHLQADVTAWVVTSFTLPLVILMPVYGRLSDAVGRRRLLLTGITICWAGTIVVIGANGLMGLVIGRAIQGAGLAGVLPLGLAMLTSVFPPETRGKALGTWSSTGPAMGFAAPIMAGFLVDSWEWRAAFVPTLIVGIIAFIAIALLVPAGLSTVRPDFWRTFDWIGVLLLAGILITFLFYLSSGPITGVPPLQDLRLLGGLLLFLIIFRWWERRQTAPFLPLTIFTNGRYIQGVLAAALRMLAMVSIFFLLPLYLVDVRGFTPIQSGIMLMVMPGSMALMVRIGGQIADRWGSRLPIISGFAVQVFTLTAFYWLPATAPFWMLTLLLIIQGVGVGIKLAPLHGIALESVADNVMGISAGFYSMIRLTGMATSTALAGVLLQLFLDQGLLQIEAYQRTFLCFVPFAILGIVVISRDRKPT